MRDFICVCWLMVLFPGVTSGGDVGACELSDEAARVLCTLADLLRASKHTAENYVQHYLEEPFEEVKLHKIIIDQNSELLEELLAKAVNEGKYTEKDADELESNAEGVQQVNDWGYWKAKEAVETGREYQDWAVKAANEALGEEDSSEDCSLIASLVQLIRCHVSGGKAGHTTTVFVKEVGQGANYTQRLDNRTREVLAHCNETGGDKEYCSGVGTALKAALDRWRELKEDEEEEDRGGCPDHTVWESHAHETSLHMIQLAENLALVETAAAKSLAHLSTFRVFRRGVVNLDSISKILKDARKAVRRGVVVPVQVNSETSWLSRKRTFIRKEVQGIKLELGKILKAPLKEKQEKRESPFVWASVVVALIAYTISVVIVLFSAISKLHKCMKAAKRAHHWKEPSGYLEESADAKDVPTDDKNGPTDNHEERVDPLEGKLAEKEEAII